MEAEIVTLCLSMWCSRSLLSKMRDKQIIFTYFLGLKRNLAQM